MNAPKLSLTNKFIIGSFIVWLIYDTIAFLMGGYDATITAAIREDTHSNPIIAVIGGILVAHFWWSSSKKK